MTAPLAAVADWGAVSALGESARQTALLLRAGANNFQSSPYVDPEGAPITVACAATLPFDLAGSERLSVLARMASEPVLASAAADLAGRRLAVALALPERWFDRSGVRGLGSEGYAFAAAFRELVPVETRVVEVAGYAYGRAAGAAALRHLARLMQQGDADAGLLCGVDSGYDWPVLEALWHADRLIGKENLDGLIPGEGAACLLLAPPASTLGARAPARIAGIGLGRETQAARAETLSTGNGLTAALKQAAIPLRAARRRCGWWISDVTHELYGVKELQIAIARFGDVLGTGTELHTPARELGDLGAATVPLYIALACEAWCGGFAPDSTALCLAASDDGSRGAVLLSGADQ